MREIKFRAWDKKHKKMITESYPAGIYPMDGNITPMIYFDGQFALMSDEDGGKSGVWEHNCAHSEEYELMQYTGLKDKNDKEIYEGDILKGEIPTSQVKFGEYENERGYADHAEGTGFYIENRDDIDSLTQSIIETYHLTIIGNIYENPELIKK